MTNERRPTGVCIDCGKTRRVNLVEWTCNYSRPKCYNCGGLLVQSKYAKRKYRPKGQPK